jgi:coenzyme F420-reducing hydrogenase beta subunit
MIRNPLGENVDVNKLCRSHPLRFASEQYEITPLLRLHEMYQLNASFDTFLIGSDQMWNYHLSKPYQQSYYFDFVADDKNKISYGTSFGANQFIGPEEEKKLVRKNLHRFQAISVRDDFSRDICERDFDIAAKIVNDPVFLCPVAAYEELTKQADPMHCPRMPFLFSYVLDPTPEFVQALRDVSKLSNLPVAVILDEPRYKDPHTMQQLRDRLGLTADDQNIQILDDPNLREWMYCFQEAKFVLTDSFHGACFSIIFQKNFLVMKNDRRGGSRFPFLLGELGLLERMVSSPKEMQQKYLAMTQQQALDISYAPVVEKLEQKKKASMQWLDDALHRRIQMKSKPVNPSLLDMQKCTGCSACVNACPKQALTLQPDAHGFYCPTLDAEKCIDCGKCEKVCPALHLPEKTNNKTPLCYAVTASDDAILQRSSSGGVFSLLAEAVLEQNGAVVGAAWRDDFTVEHILITKKEELPKLQKSKYLQSYLGNVFQEVKKRLEQGQLVLFSGCPCQVAGLTAYLGKSYQNLIKVDLLCGNSPSAMFFKKYLASSFPDGIEQYEFRYKAYGWNCDCIAAKEKKNDSVTVHRGKSQDDYQKVFHNHTMCAPHCEQCQYQSLPRFGDLTIGDFWGISKKDSSLDTKNGVSVVLCNNEKGQHFFDAIPEEKMRLKKREPLEWLDGNGYALEGKHNYCSSGRDRFYKAIQDMSFSDAVDYALLSEYAQIAKHSVVPLQYNTPSLHFSFDPTMWEEHFIKNKTVLLTKVDNPPRGHFAYLPLSMPLTKGKKYVLYIRFCVKTDAKQLNFHVMDSRNQKLKVIHSYVVPSGATPEWKSVLTEFVPGYDFYNSFSVGAAQVFGKGSYFAIDQIMITEKK